MDSAPNQATAQIYGLHHKYQVILDRFATRYVARWSFTAVALTIYVIRVYLASGWFVVSYGLGIYLLNLLIGFLSPRDDPEMVNMMDSDLEADGGGLPTKNTDEFRPFIRRISEFNSWKSATHAIIFSFFLTLFDMFDVPVFWPLLLVYFLMLFFVTMKRQIMHMIQYRYLPFDFGKKKYKSKENK